MYKMVSSSTFLFMSVTQHQVFSYKYRPFSWIVHHWKEAKTLNKNARDITLKTRKDEVFWNQKERKSKSNNESTTDLRVNSYQYDLISQLSNRPDDKAGPTDLFF